MNLLDARETDMWLVDILQLIPFYEKVCVRLIHDFESSTVVTGTPKEIAFEKEEWLSYEILCVTRELSETELMQIDIMKR